MPTAPLPIPGIRLLAPAPAVAAGAIAFNVYFLRPFHPGALSGKLSDLGINFLLPVLLVSVAEWGLLLLRAARRRRFEPLGPVGVASACALSACYFSLLKLVPGFALWHVALLRTWASPFSVSVAFRVVADPSDLLTLVMTPLAGLYLMRADPCRRR
jgi:hypothetical protein